ncbi:MAG: hypothetical protein LBI17_04000 [Rickettsiales bacterium]|jgi:hypothetical protein|nr:hypothetical protein [Rickettsiales bacterium]
MMNSKDLSVLAYSNGFTLWHYKSSLDRGAVEAEDYFDGVADIFNAGDLIFISAMDAGRNGTLVYSIKSVDGGKVAVARM